MPNKIYTKLFTHPVLCLSCHSYGPLRLAVAIRPWHCPRCLAIHDLSHATLNVNDGQSYVEEPTARSLTALTIRRYALDGAQQ